MDQALANIDAGLAAAGMNRGHVVKLTVYLTSAAPEAIATYRARRDVWVGDGVAPAATLLVVAGLAAPGWLVEIDMIAAS
jgi:enamine deaminase RidA (YjgF/YER057c/UK114 family)